MQWILLGVLGLALLALSSYYPKVAASILVALAVAAALVVFTTREEGSWRRAQLPAQDIQIENAVMLPGYADSYQFSARLVNAHQSISLKEAVVSITMLDCASQLTEGEDSIGIDSTDCTVLGQTEKRFTVQIPPQQARNISRNISFESARFARGTVRWQYRVLQTRS